MKPVIAKQTIRLHHGDIAYLETGAADRPPVLLVHGIPTSGFLWRHVLRFLQNDFHCYAPDLMGLGDTVVDPATTPMHMDAQAEMLLELMDALGHDRFALVAHDQGGAAAQIIAAHQPHRVSCLVLADVVGYDNWPVPAVRRLQRLAQFEPAWNAVAGSGLIEWLETRTRASAMRRGVWRPDKLTDQAIAEYLRPLRDSRASRERFRRFVLAGHPRYTQLAVDGLRRFDRPTMIVWAADDRYLSPSWGRQLYEDIPGAERFELVPFCGHFWPEERPAEFASHIGGFLADQLGRRPQPAEPEVVLDARAVHRLPVVDQPVVDRPIADPATADQPADPAAS